MRHLLLLVTLIFLTFQVYAQNVGIGTNSPTAKLEIAGGGLLIAGTAGTIDSIGAGTRLMWIPEQRAFRAGAVNDTAWDNPSIGLFSFAGGGVDNTASGQSSFIGGGAVNTASHTAAFVGGGGWNTASGPDSFVGGGGFNIAGGLRSFTGGGRSLSALGGLSFVGGGFFNTATGTRSFVGGGGGNLASGYSSFVAGGENLIARSFAEVVIGTNNTDYTALDTVDFNAGDRLFVIGNGTSVDDRSNAVTVLKNGNVGIAAETPAAALHIEEGALLAKGSTGTIDSIGAGIRLMWIPEKKAFRAGEVTGTQWDANYIGDHSFVGAGIDNTASGDRSFVGGGSDNTATGVLSFAGGGFTNDASGNLSFVGGGSFNIALGSESFVGGGSENTASGVLSFVGSGEDNTALGSYSFVGSGEDNTASGDRSFVGGGENLVARSYGEVVFGLNNTDYAPNSAITFDTSDRLFVIGNGTSFFSRSDAMTVLKNGNVGIGTSSPDEKLHVVGNICYTGTSAACSDTRYKERFLPIPNALQKINTLNGVYYYWKQEEFPDKNFSADRQIGVIAQEVQAIFPEMVTEDADGYLSVDYSRLTPVLIESVKELTARSEEQQQEIRDLHQRLAKLELIISKEKQTDTDAE